MPIFYSVVARGDTVLSEHTIATGNFITVSSVILGRISPTETRRMSYAYDTHVFHFIVYERITFMCMCDSQFPRRLAFGFLDQIRDMFLQRVNIYEAQNANSFAYRDFSNVLNQQMDFFSNDPSADKIQLAKHQIEESRKQLEENIDTILKRDEKVLS